LLPQADNYNIAVYNTVGKVVSTARLSDTLIHIIDLGNVVAGVYNVKVSNGKGNFNKLVVVE